MYNFRRPESSICLVKRTLGGASIIVHIKEETNQRPTIDHIIDGPFIDFLDVKYVNNGKRASLLTMPSCHSMMVDTKGYDTFSAVLTPVIIMDILRENEVTVLKTRQSEQQRMLWLVTNDILKLSPHIHSTTDHENESASLKCQVFIVRTLNKRKSVNVTVLMVPHDVFTAIFPKSHCLAHVYSGPDAAMMHRNVISIGKHGL